MYEAEIISLRHKMMDLQEAEGLIQAAQRLKQPCYEDYRKLLKEFEEYKNKTLEATIVAENIEMFQKMKSEVKGECISFAAMYTENISLGREVTMLKDELRKTREEVGFLKTRNLNELYGHLKDCIEWMESNGYKEK